MNWLAHILLAGDNEDDQLGGVLADLLTMPQTKLLPPVVRHGVALHQAIDAFSDAHPAVAAIGQRVSSAGVGLRPAAAAIAVDMLYDHLLARRWDFYCPARNLETFSMDFYRVASGRMDIIPSGARMALDLMQVENWLVSYRDLGEIRHVLERIRRRLSSTRGGSVSARVGGGRFCARLQGIRRPFRAFLAGRGCSHKSL